MLLIMSKLDINNYPDNLIDPNNNISENNNNLFNGPNNNISENNNNLFNGSNTSIINIKDISLEQLQINNLTNKIEELKNKIGLNTKINYIQARNNSLKSLYIIYRIIIGQDQKIKDHQK